MLLAHIRQKYINFNTQFKNERLPLTAILLPIIAVLLGAIVALIFKPNITQGVKLLLSFSGAFLLSIIVLEILPEIYESGEDNVGLFVMAGLLLQIILEFGSKGAEHGHVHHKDSSDFPWILFVSLCVHAFIEGFPLAGNERILYGVVVHKIPIAVIIATFLLSSQMARRKSIAFLFIFAMMTPLGALAKGQLPVLLEYATIVNAFVVGVLLHVSTTILFESSKNHQFNASKLGVIILGVIIAYFI